MNELHVAEFRQLEHVGHAERKLLLRGSTTALYDICDIIVLQYII
jgi:hypothetical protein